MVESTRPVIMNDHKVAILGQLVIGKPLGRLVNCSDLSLAPSPNRVRCDRSPAETHQSLAERHFDPAKTLQSLAENHFDPAETLQSLAERHFDLAKTRQSLAETHFDPAETIKKHWRQRGFTMVLPRPLKSLAKAHCGLGGSR